MQALSPAADQPASTANSSGSLAVPLIPTSAHRPTPAQPEGLIQAWTRIRARLQREVGEVEYRTWLRHMALVGLDGDEVTVSLPSRFLRDWVRTTYADKLNGLWQAEMPDVRRVDLRIGGGVEPTDLPAPAMIGTAAHPAAQSAVVQAEPALEPRTDSREVAGPLDTVGGRRDLVDLVGYITATDKLSFILNYDWGQQQSCGSGPCPAVTPGSTITATWQGWAGYANYQFNDQWRLSLRGEWFDDEDGYRTGVVQKWKEATVTLAYLPNKNFELRAEIRGDRSNAASFVDSNGLTAGKSQNSYGLQALYKF